MEQSDSNYVQLISDRADLDYVAQIERRLRRIQMPPQDRLGHGIDLVVMGAIWKCGALFDEIVDPWRVLRMGQIDVTGFD